MPSCNAEMIRIKVDDDANTEILFAHFCFIETDMIASYLYSLASPKWFYHQGLRFERLLASLSVVFLSIGLIFALWISPEDYQQGQSVRIMYVHVPSAVLSMMIYAWMGGLSIALLVWRVKLAGMMLKPCAVLGSGMTALALATGSLWGKPMWGTWWVWDARLTSEFILLMLYLGILTLPSSFRRQEAAEKAMAVLTLVGLIDLPIIHYSVIWWNTLHQGSSFPLGQKPLIDSSMLIPLGLMFLGCLCFVIWTLVKLTSAHILQRELHTQWVKKLFHGESL